MKQILKNTIYSFVGVLVVVSFIGCNDLSVLSNITPRDLMPPAHSVLVMSEVSVADAELLFTLENSNDEEVRARITLTPDPPDEAMIVVGEDRIPFSEVEPISVPATDREQIRITRLENGTPYTLIVTTLDTVGNARRGITVATATPLPAFTGELTTFYFIAKNEQITLNWNNVVSATEYRVYRDGETDPIAVISNQIDNALITYTDKNLISDTEYTYTIRVVDRFGTESDFDNNIRTRTLIRLPDPPQNLTAVEMDMQVDLDWDDVSGATEYRIYRSIGTTPATRLPTTPEILIATNYSDTGLTNGTHYTYMVRAVNSAGEGDASGTITAIPR